MRRCSSGLLLQLGAVWTGLGPAVAGQPTEAVRAGPARVVLAADPAEVTGTRQRGQVPVQIQSAGAWLVPAGRVGDLHVADPVGVGGDGRVDVVAIDGQVVQVRQQRDVAGT